MFARDVFANYMITALWLKDELNEQEFKIVDEYINKMYKKFIKPIELQKKKKAFIKWPMVEWKYLNYRILLRRNDKELSAEEINHRFNEMEKLFLKMAISMIIHLEDIEVDGITHMD